MNRHYLSILEFCIAETERGNDCFFEYMGHVRSIHVHCHRGKWEVCKKAVFDRHDINRGRMTKAKAERWIAAMKKSLGY